MDILRPEDDISNLHKPRKGCETCQIQIVESIPEGLVYNSTIDHLRTYDVRIEQIIKLLGPQIMNRLQ